MTMYKLSKKSWWARLLLAPVAIAASAFVMSLSRPAHAAEFTVYKTPWCGCCEKWVNQMKAKGHSVTIKDMEDLDIIKKTARVPENLQACHTAVVGDYIIEGHVPAEDIERLLAERPKAKGLAVPGMPMGSPGMDGGGSEKYDVMLFKIDGTSEVYAKH